MIAWFAAIHKEQSTRIALLALMASAVPAGPKFVSPARAAQDAPLSATRVAVSVPHPAAPSSGMAQPAAPSGGMAQPAAPSGGMAQPAPMLRVAASNLAALTLMPKMAASFLTEAGDTGVHAEPGQNASETLIAGRNHGRLETISIDATSSAGALASLRDGQADLAVASRQVSPEEAGALQKLGDMNTPAAEHVIGVDGLVVVANASNPLRMLTTDQVQGLLGGAYSDWNSVGGPPGMVSVYVADRTSETGRATDRLALHGGAWAPTTRDMPGDEQIARAVSQDPHGIGVITLPSLLLHRRFAADLRMLAVADTGSPPLVPTNRPAMAALDYPYAFRLYLYVSPTASNETARRFVDFIDSRDGEAVAETQGLVSQSMSPSELIVPDSASDRFRQFVAGSKLLAVHFRFLTASSNLDVAGQRDLDRVTKYLKDNKYSGDNLILAGFADNVGAPAANIALSEKRAAAMAALLAQRGLKPGKVAGFGAELPLTNNSTEEGRQRNRRVEIYLLP